MFMKAHSVVYFLIISYDGCPTVNLFKRKIHTKVNLIENEEKERGKLMNNCFFFITKPRFIGVLRLLFLILCPTIYFSTFS